MVPHARFYIVLGVLALVFVVAYLWSSATVMQEAVWHEVETPAPADPALIRDAQVRIREMQKEMGVATQPANPAAR